VVDLDNFDEKKYKCPYCGYEMNKKQSRCENCASILDIKAEPEEKPFKDESIEYKPSDEVTDSQDSDMQNDETGTRPIEEKTEKKETEENFENKEEKKAPTENIFFETKDNNSFFGNSFSNQPYNSFNKNSFAPVEPKPLTNAMKVALTTLCVLVPVIGQFIGLVLSIIYMNTDEELKDCDDRRSFGLALLIACVIAFVMSVFGGFTILLFIAQHTT
jgi:hypothetical protein